MRSWILTAVLLAGCASNKQAVEPTPDPVSDAGPVAKVEVEDPYLWLEEVTGTKPLEWVEVQNKKALAELDSPAREKLRAQLLAIYDSKEKIPVADVKGKWLYNFWRDEKNARGLWRRVSLEGFKKKDPPWETVIDVDALSEAEKENWVFSSVDCVKPKEERCLVFLSRGGGDAMVTREFDTVKKAFVKDGFVLPEAKATVAWKDENTLYVATDFGPGTLTTSGYPRQVKEWKRGTPLADAKLLLEGKDSDVDVLAFREFNQGKTIDVAARDLTFFSTEEFLVIDGKLEKLEKPDDAKVGFFGDLLLLELRSDWKVGETVFPAGALVATKLKDFRAGKRDLELLYTPAKNSSLLQWAKTKNHVVLNVLEDVKNKLTVLTTEKGKWKRTPLATTGSVFIDAFDSDASDQLWVHVTDFTVPPTVELVDLKTSKRAVLKSMPAFFDATGLETKQYFATSKDGTKVPYFVVAKKDLALDGNTPVLLTGYGGFEISSTPFYSGGTGAAWFDKGAFVLANIRGGGEYGPQWHETAIKQNRQRAYDDFIAVAEDLIARKLTSPKRLGIQGGSNGGLLMGVMLTQRPDLFNAIVCSVPLLDMKRYHTLLAGASWMGEYGDPGVPDEWAAIAKYSPYQNVKKGTKYPRILFTTSTRDDRVHPGHARKMVARMLEQGHDVQYFENTEGGHAGAANNAQRANLVSLEFAFLTNQLTK